MFSWQGDTDLLPFLEDSQFPSDHLEILLRSFEPARDEGE
jgi:hypothetical protein